MNLSEYNFEKYKIQEDFQSMVENDLDLLFTDKEEVRKISEDAEHPKYDIQFNAGDDRGWKYVAIPKDIRLPFLSYSLTTLPNDEHRVDFSIGWSDYAIDDKGKKFVPEGVKSSTALRYTENMEVESNKPAIYSGSRFSTGELVMKDVLFTDRTSFRRYVLSKDGSFVTERYLYVKNEKITKIYELNEPVFVSYFPNGNPKEVWFSNPKAKTFPQTSCSFRHKDDHPVVVSYYEDGDVHYVDYTGYYFSFKDVQDIIHNYPFHSRYRFYLPSLYRFNNRTDKTEEQEPLEKRYFFFKRELSEIEALETVGAWGIDVSSSEIIEQTLEANPFFEESIRSLHGISLVSDEQLDNTLMLLQLKM
tara:strand:- start:26058 stop:27140 length:1083 start_codon:yes stop_codon:yes gene_type:complete